MDKIPFSDGDPSTGTPGTIVSAAFLNWLQDQLVPVGAVAHFGRATPPVGWLECNGDSVPNGNGTVQGVTADFSGLYAALGTAFGTAGKLPDLRDDFIRGAHGTSRPVGTRESDMVGPHTHQLPYGALALSNGLAIGYGSTMGQATAQNDGTETRPRNVALLACIKY